MTRPQPQIRRLPFVEFSETVLNLRYSPAWRVLLRVAVDRVEPKDLEPAEREIARQLFGDVDVIPEVARRVMVWRLGRGSGKTTVAAALTIWAMWTAVLDRVGPGQIAAGVVVGPTKPAGGIAVGIGRALVRNSDLEAYVEKKNDTSEGFQLRRPDGRVVAFRSVAASRGGHGLRGFDIIAVIFDESEFFASNDETADGGYAVSDRDQFAAASPRLLEFALFISTPWPVPNLTDELFTRNWGRPTDALAALGSSLLMRPDNPVLAKDIERALAHDEESARREYFGVRGGDGGTILDPADVVVMARPLHPQVRPLGVGAGFIDASKGTDNYVAIFGQFVLEPSNECEYLTREHRQNGVLIMRDAYVYDEKTGKPLPNPKWSEPAPRLWISGIMAFERGFAQKMSFSSVVAEIAAAGRAFGIKTFYGDEWSDWEHASEFSKHGCTFQSRKTTAKGKGDAAATLARMARERTIVLEPGDQADKMKRELLAARIVYRPGGVVTFESKRTPGQGHGDRLSALILACRLCAEGAIEGNPMTYAGGSCISWDPYGPNE